jgi:hypothetical protein
MADPDPDHGLGPAPGSNPQRRRWLRTALLGSIGLAGSILIGGRARASSNALARPVARSDLVEAFRAQKALGYRLDRIGHAARMQAGVLLHLAARAEAADASAAALRVDHRDYAAAFGEATGLGRDAWPGFVRAAAEVGEDLLVEHRLSDIVDGMPPAGLRRALNVKAGWPPGPSVPAGYRVLDTSSDPHVETMREQIGTWRVLDYGDMVVQDEIQGVSGRATSGLLGAVFTVLGQARVLQSRFATAADGLLVVRTAVRSGFTVTQSATVTPDGVVRPGLLPNRPDLEAIEDRLTQVALPARYKTIDRSPMSPRPAG